MIFSLLQKYKVLNCLTIIQISENLPPFSMLSLQINDSHLSSQNIERQSLIINPKSRHVQIQMPDIL